MLNRSRSKNSAHKGSSQEWGWGKRGLLVPIPPSIPAFYANVLRISARVPSEDCVTSQRSSAWEATPNPLRSRELFASLSGYRNENMIEVRSSCAAVLSFANTSFGTSVRDNANHESGMIS